MSKINGLLKLSYDGSPLIVKIEELIDIPKTCLSSNNTFSARAELIFDNSLINDIFANRIIINGESRIYSTDTYSIGASFERTEDDIYVYKIAQYNNVKSAIFTLSFNEDGNNQIKMTRDFYQITLRITFSSSIIYEFPIYITNNILHYNIYDKQTQMIASNMESFMLLRTNPKLTGNIKLVVTSDYNLYLDTFKISNNSILNKKEYRHQPISTDGNYPYDVYHTFKFLPATEMYGIYPDSYDPHISYHKMEDQIRNIYEYGAEYNDDKLYAENLKILAPLYIGKHLPDYFVIWRSDRLITKNNTITNADVFKQLLSESKCIKIFDLRRSTTIGKYLHSYQETVTTYLAGTCALQFIEQDNDKNSVDHRQGQNTWKGIAYDKGILTDRNETTYFATKTIEGDCAQENFDMFLLNGYSRNNLLFPNIINLEYMFNDEDAEDFSMHNYFGLYLTENDFITFNQVIQLKTDTDNYDLQYYDVSNNMVNINTTPIDVIEDDKFKDRIFFASTKNAAINLDTLDDLNLFTKNEAVNKPNENLAQISGVKMKFKDKDKALLTLDFTEQIRYGEHFKFIIPKYQDGENYKQVIFELIASNDERLKDTRNHISPYVQTNIPVRVNEVENEEKYEIYRIAFYTQDINDKTQYASLKEQITRIKDAILKFDNVISVSSYSDESIAFVSTVKDVYFQHILANEFTEKRSQYSKNINLNNIEVYDTLRYYNYNNIQKCEYIEYNNVYFDIHYLGYANNGLEETCERYANITKFINIDDFANKFIYETEKDLYEETNIVSYPLIFTVNGYYPMVKFSNSNADLKFNLENRIKRNEFVLNDNSYITIISPYDVTKSILCSPYEIEYVNGQINICSPLSLHIALMGINDIKDIDVYMNNDESSSYSTDITATFKAGEKVKLDNTDLRIKKYITYSIISGSIYGIPTGELNSFTITDDTIYYTNAADPSIYTIQLKTDYLEFGEDTIISLVSNNSLDIYNYTVNYPVLNETNYYYDNIHTDKSNLNISLVPLLNCQWKSNGCYFDNLSLLDVNNLVSKYDIVGNFIECDYTPSTTNQYVANSLNDVIVVDNTKVSIMDQIIQTGSIKKYLCVNNKIDTAIGYYNPYVQTLEFIFYGIKFIFKLSSNEYANEIKLNEFNNYEVYMINDYTNSDTNDIIISKAEEFILIVNHVYRSGYYYGNSNIKTYKDGIIQDINYNWYKSPYAYEMSNITLMNTSLYVNKNNSYILQDLDYLKSIIEIDAKDQNNLNFNTNYAYFDIDSSFKSFNHYDINASRNLYIDNVSNHIIENNLQLLTNYYLNSDFDIREKNNYLIKQNTIAPEHLKAISYSDKINAYIESFNNNINMYIIDNEIGDDTSNNTTIEHIKITNNYKPLTIEMITPNMVKYNNGLFNPNFVDVFNFELNDNISDRIGMDTLYGNTCITSINSLKSYYYNKVLDNESTYTYNYFVEPYRSPFSTNWDDNIYRQYSGDDVFKYIQGYVVGVDDKMFFGSKALNLHNNSITLSKWDYNKNINTAKYNISKYNEHSKQKTVLEISLNLTKTFYDYFLNHKSFVNNWKDIKNFASANIYINNYITNVLYNLYDFKGNFDITLYKKYSETIKKKKLAKDHFIYSVSKNQKFDEIEQNYKTEFKDINNEVILTITISDYQNFVYYPVVKINKI